MFPYPAAMLTAAAATGGGGGSDPYFAAVVLLCGFEGSNGSTSFVDESSSAKALTAAGNAHIDTSQSKFGVSSLRVDGTGGTYVAAPSSSDWAFGTGDFTVEYWLYVNAITSFFTPVSCNGWYARQSGSTLSYSFGTSFSVTNTFSTGQWHHVAVDRVAGVIRVYKNGVMLQKNTDTSSMTSTTAMQLGQQGTQTSTVLNGWLDEVRITKGIARYASDAGFSVPTAAFPRS